MTPWRLQWPRRLGVRSWVRVATTARFRWVRAIAHAACMGVFTLPVKTPVLVKLPAELPHCEPAAGASESCSPSVPPMSSITEGRRTGRRGCPGTFRWHGVHSGSAGTACTASPGPRILHCIGPGLPGTSPRFPSRPPAFGTPCRKLPRQLPRTFGPRLLSSEGRQRAPGPSEGTFGPGWPPYSSSIRSTPGCQ